MDRLTAEHEVIAAIAAHSSVLAAEAAERCAESDEGLLDALTILAGVYQMLGKPTTALLCERDLWATELKKETWLKKFLATLK